MLSSQDELRINGGSSIGYATGEELESVVLTPRLRGERELG